MRMKQHILKKLYSLDRIKVLKQGKGSWTVRGCFTLSEEHDDVKRFIFLKRMATGLSFLRFKKMPVLKPTIYIDIPTKKLSESDYEKIKLQLWRKLKIYISHKLEETLLPKMVFV